MNDLLLNIKVQEFINNNLNSDTLEILLKKPLFSSIKNKEIVEQIDAKKRCKTKLPTWFRIPKAYYPNKLNIEQTSSEVTANYKSQLIHGESLIDLTGGFGVDSYYFSKQFDNVTYCEIDQELSEIAAYNFKQLNVSNIVTKNIDGIEYLKQNNTKYDWIYLDPSRRHQSKGKVYFLKDCLPNVPEQLETLFPFSKNILIKTSPLLDISVGISELKHVKSIHIVAVNNEVKELLWVLEKDYEDEISISTININKGNNEVFSFKLNDEAISNVHYGVPLTYLYEPNAAILKSGAFKSLSHKLTLFKIHQHSHIYTLNQLIDFPGKKFIIDKVIPYKKQYLKKELISKANIVTRNFPETVEQIRKKLNIKEGGNLFLFFTTDINDTYIVIICQKV
ncbi:class I SAM-dependent methyltransferase [Yeosuana sp. MJ-SS3]|uniref:Class I SAM-dependent methyltransferase n=1 Tax=Gilvirhabdus luticola TaxID=3079858 RepID=A0ABU3U9B1_9FLAO|nr:class I SAM-dependent methyltransferase [Yeosuana sp. MJ-SS3]MDU8886996.1 class I SAM-dependent methyltransferase [Yeosuana sp. MJ-SS3]